jgi:hypothetical protein
MTDLHAETQAVVEELDPDGGGFSSKEATDLLHYRIESAGIVQEDGRPKKHISMMLRSACASMISNYKPERAAHLAVGSGQGDFQQIRSAASSTIGSTTSPRWARRVMRSASNW